ncbi:MAG: tRNA (adenosine(37)-N6)-dimethylallyltransferase MiaA [Flavobacteriales bacterium]
MKPKLIVITGPTASGKTSLAIWLAQQLACEIISADSRQIFRELKIGSAAPDDSELQAVPHHFIATHSITEAYNAGKFEAEALEKLHDLFMRKPIQIVCGGSGMYIRALLHGFDELPEADSAYRLALNNIFQNEGIYVLQDMLREKDMEYYQQVDVNNPQRIIRALEVIHASGKPFSSFRKGKKVERDFDTLVLSMYLPREELYKRINQRTLHMIKLGWVEECKQLKEYRALNALQTVGYKEIFAYLDDKFELEKCIGMIQQNTRRFAKRQVTYIKNQLQAHFVHPDDKHAILKLVNDFISA